MARKNKRKRLIALNFDTALHLGINYTQCCKIVLMFANGYGLCAFTCTAYSPCCRYVILRNLNLKLNYMNWQEAIQKSKKGTATRVEEKNGKRHTTIRYKDGSGFLLVGKNMKVDFSNSRQATSKELNGFNDWQPSK